MTIHSSFRNWLPFLFIIILSACSTTEVAPQSDDTPKTLDGKYVGGWTSTTQFTSFSNFPISIDLILSADKTKLTGDFYATVNYSSCCNSGTSDGRISIALDGDIITSFSLNVVIPDCTGNFSGSGEIKPNGNLVIDITGKDCDGDHVGQLVFRK